MMENERNAVPLSQDTNFAGTVLAPQYAARPTLRVLGHPKGPAIRILSRP